MYYAKLMGEMNLGYYELENSKKNHGHYFQEQRENPIMML
jgi:hypothetical protein